MKGPFFKGQHVRLLPLEDLLALQIIPSIKPPILRGMLDAAGMEGIVLRDEDETPQVFFPDVIMSGYPNCVDNFLCYYYPDEALVECKD